MQKEKTTFTKAIMSIVVLLYFLGALLGGILVIVAAGVDISLGFQIDASMFIAYATYLAAPTATAIGFYAWKSKAENILKIANSQATAAMNSDGAIPFDPSVFTNMGV